MSERDPKNKSLDDLLHEDKKLSSSRKTRDERDERRSRRHERSHSREGRRDSTPNCAQLTLIGHGITSSGSHPIYQSNRVFVSNLAYETDWRKLKDFMRRETGDVVRADIFEDDRGRSKGLG